MCDNQLKWERVKDASGCDFSTLSLAADGPRGEADLWVPSPLVAQLTDEVVTSGGFPMRGGDFRKPESWRFYSDTSDLALITCGSCRPTRDR